MKYIVFSSPEGPRVHAFFAPSTHREEATAHPRWQPVSAGYVEFLGECKVRVYSRSDSLNIDPAPRDQALIEAFLRAGRVLTPLPKE